MSTAHENQDECSIWVLYVQISSFSRFSIFFISCLDCIVCVKYTWEWI